MTMTKEWKFLLGQLRFDKKEKQNLFVDTGARNHFTLLLCLLMIERVPEEIQHFRHVREITSILF